MNKFNDTFAYKLIYVFRIKDKDHEGLLKIGEATCHTNEDIAKLFPNCTILNQSAKKRIDQYTNTAKIHYELLYTELAVRYVVEKGKTTLKAFSDHDVHKVLIRSGIDRHIFDKIKGTNEWFKVNLETVKNAIKAVKNNQYSLKANEITNTIDPIEFRPEQKEAIKKTKDQFKHSDKMLWNAKMRFGKTLTALQVAKEMKFEKIIILTHRPVVSEGWFEDFNKIFYDTDYVYGSKTKGEKIENLIDTDKKFVYFASMQDLRGSQVVGGKFSKNEDIYLVEWDFVVIDEAHEGTLTKLGQAVIDEICNQKKKPKVLKLSGTPFNLLDQFKTGEIFTWDYVMEQREKALWDKLNLGDSNPYSSLPSLQIFTYDLNNIIKGYYNEEDRAFNFREFFRTWTGDIRKDFKPIPNDQKIGDFVHREDVNSFLNLLCKSDSDNNYPFSTEEYKNYFRHTLWIVPGVREAKALANLLDKHSIFGNKTYFRIVNVAGDGLLEEESKDALKAVKDAFGDDPSSIYTITISCGRLTTGVTIPEWTAVFMLSGTLSTSASSYLQTIFRVQSPANINGKIKEYCCVFDFAPDRTLKMVAEAGKLSTKSGNVSNDREQMGEFLNYCPVIGIDGSKMKEFDVDTMLQQLKKAYTDRVVKNGFDDQHIYNDNLLKLDGLELKEFENLKKIIGATKQTKKQNDFDINKQGLTNEQYEEIEKIEKKPKKDLTEEDKKKLEELKEKKKNKDTAMSILRGISIRIPLLVYGSEIDDNVEITTDNFAELIDQASWEEFMPKGVTKDIFNKFAKYYEKDIFISAGRQIRNKARVADKLSPEERVYKIVEIFDTFKNPDKETVLTPWRVVNMHLGNTLGGYNFYDDKFEEILTEPRFIDQGKVTQDTLMNLNSQILEINSKTGLYPLYVTYSIYRKRCEEIDPNELTKEKQIELWNKTVKDNIFVICKTPMAKSITQRTLLGYQDIKINSYPIENDLITQLKEKPEQFKDKILRESFWNKGDKKMKFDAIVGNPPYQMSDGGAQASATPVYNLFVDISKKLSANYISMIMPSRWMTGGKGLDKFRDEMIHDKGVCRLIDHVNSKDCFSNVDIKGGICYFLRDIKYKDKCHITTIINSNEKIDSIRYLVEGEDEIFIRDSRLLSIKNKVLIFKAETFEKIVSPRKPYGLSGDIFKDEEKYKLPKMSNTVIDNGITIYGLDDRLKRIKKYVNKDYPFPKKTYLDGYKMFMSRNQGTGILGEEFSIPIFAKPNEACTETFVVIGLFENELQMQNCWKYMKTKFFRIMVGIRKQDQGASRAIYHYVPLQDFTEKSDIDWTKTVSEIDKQLYKKYNLNEEEIDFIEKTVKPMD